MHDRDSADWDVPDWDVLHEGFDREYDAPDRFDLGSLPRQIPRVEPMTPPSPPQHAFPQEAWPQHAWPEVSPEQVWPQQEANPYDRPHAGGRQNAPALPPQGVQPGQGAAAPAPRRRTHRSLVRPYARTGGRVRPATDLQLESLVSTYDVAGAMAAGAVATTVQRFICDLCVEVKSVAEIAAYARLPLGVVKVMVSDLADAGAVTIQRPGMLLGDRSSQAFMERILEGLKAL